jgi:membrane-associated phospholipid phosphatase
MIMMAKFNKTPYLAFLLIFPLLGYVYRILNTHTPKATILLTSLDSNIPFIPVFILPYIFWYGFILGYLIYFCFKDTKVYVKTLTVIVLGELVSFIIYFFFPTTIPRPLLEDNGVIIDLVRLVYWHDQPYNCFPSIHVLTTFSIILGSIHVKNKHIFHTTFIPIGGSLIIISTLFVKQHGILDVFGSIFLSLIMYGIAFYFIRLQKTKTSKNVYLKDSM